MPELLEVLQQLGGWIRGCMPYFSSHMHLWGTGEIVAEQIPPEVVHTSKDFVGKKHTHSDMGVFQASHLSIMHVYNTNKCIHACMH